MVEEEDMTRSTRKIAALLAVIVTSSWTVAIALETSVKPQLRGLLFMGNIGFLQREETEPNNSLDEIQSVPAGIFDGIVINVTWAQLQPAPSDFVTASIDNALGNVRAFNQQHPQTPLGVKLRVWQSSAPDWVKNLDGEPVRIITKKGDGSNVHVKTVGRFWSANYRQAWQRLQMQLANKYDSEPLIREVTDTSCSSLTDEPFIVDGEPESIQNMLRAGFTDEAYRNCLLKSPSDYEGWRTTSIDFAFGSYRMIGGGKATPDPPVIVQVMAAFRKALGQRAILSNHALATPGSLSSRGLLPVMDDIKQFGPPIEFQTAHPHAAWLQGGELDWDETINYGISLGATTMELWGWGRSGGFVAIPPKKLQAWSAALKNNHAR
jgi:hypothetical protein